VPATLEDVADRLPLVVGQVFELEDLTEAQHRVERGAQLVAHPGQELALGPVGRLGRLVRLASGLVGAPAVVDVDDVAEDRGDPPLLVGFGDEGGRDPARDPAPRSEPVLDLLPVRRAVRDTVECPVDEVPVVRKHHAAEEPRRQRLLLGHAEQPLDVRAHVGDLAVRHRDPPHENGTRCQQVVEERPDVGQVAECTLQLTGPRGHQPQRVATATGQHLDHRGREHRQHESAAQQEPREAPGERADKRLPGAHGEQPAVGADGERDAPDTAAQWHLGLGGHHEPSWIGGV